MGVFQQVLETTKTWKINPHRPHFASPRLARPSKCLIIHLIYLFLVCPMPGTDQGGTTNPPIFSPRWIRLAAKDFSPSSRQTTMRKYKWTVQWCLRTYRIKYKGRKSKRGDLKKWIKVWTNQKIAYSVGLKYSCLPFGNPRLKEIMEEMVPQLFWPLNWLTIKKNSRNPNRRSNRFNFHTFLTAFKHSFFKLSKNRRTNR